jgi:putative transcriptional regulator
MDSIKGKILLAHPFLKDPNFKRMVVLICDDTVEGHYGLILNNSLSSLQVDDFLPEKIGVQLPVLVGGPVEPTYMQYIHRCEVVEGSKGVKDNLWVGGDFEQVKMFLNLEKIPPEDIRFFIGYAGWGNGQLEKEMQSDSWIVADFNWEYLNYAPEEMWKKVLRYLGKGDLVHYPIDPRLN